MCSSDLVFLSQQPDGGFAVHITTERPRHIDMRPVTVQRYCANGEPCTTWQDFVPAPRFENIAAAHSDGGNESPQDDLRVRRHLVEPLMLSPPGRGEVPGLRIAWPGEVWPCFQLHLAGPLQSNTTLSSRTLGNAMTIALSRVAA